MTGLVRVGVVGLEGLGLPIARRLAVAAGQVLVQDEQPERADGLYAGLVRQVPTAAEVGAQVKVVCVTVQGDEQAGTVVDSLLDTMKPGTAIVIMSPVRLNTVDELAKKGRARAVHIVDAATYGDEASAEQGTLTIMVGADVEAFALVRPVLEALSDTVLCLGPPGAGTAMLECLPPQAAA